MATYIVLMKFTDQGIRTIKNSPERATQAAELAKTFGCEMMQIYWTVGEYDGVVITEAQDEQSAAAFSYAISALGNVRTQSLRAFTKDEVSAVVAKLP
jgi:uncharacterized protein with GYD domain